MLDVHIDLQTARIYELCERMEKLTSHRYRFNIVKNQIFMANLLQSSGLRLHSCTFNAQLTSVP